MIPPHTDVLYLPEEVDWIKFNVDMSGYYIVHYEGSGWDDLITLLKHDHTTLTSNDRASLINTAFQLVRSVIHILIILVSVEEMYLIEN